MAKNLLLGIFFFLSQVGVCQSAKSYALVVGVSDYQYVNDLNYADDDAEAFYSYLLTATNGKFQAENVRKLTNKEATGAAILNGLSWLMKTAKAGDLVLIYFAGHGGYENLTFKKLGFLLAHDGFMDTYTAGGNIPLEYLNNVFETFAFHEIRTLFVADACHSGKSTDHDVNEAMLINSRLAVDLGQVTKILSAQGAEKSFEDAKWGGGHGVFTYYLIRALIGFADDSPKDTYVSVREVDRYLNESVSIATGYSQNPTVVGPNRNLAINRVDEKAYPAIRELLNDSTKKHNLLGVLSRGFGEQKVVTPLSEREQLLYDSLNTMMAANKLIHPDKLSAYTYYDRLMINAKDSTFRSKITSAYHTKLTEFAQLVINRYLNASFDNSTEDYFLAALGLRYVTSQLEKKSESYALFKSQEKFLSYYAERKEKGDKGLLTTPEYQLQSNKPLREAIELMPDAAYLYNVMGLYFSDRQKNDSSIYYYKMAEQRAPRWVAPLNNLGNDYRRLEDYDRALSYLDSAKALRPDWPMPYSTAGAIHLARKDYDRSKVEYLSSIERLKDRPNTDLFKAFSYEGLADIEFIQGNATKSLEYYQKWNKIQPTNLRPWLRMAILYFELSNYTESISASNQYLKFLSESLPKVDSKVFDQRMIDKSINPLQVGYLLENGIGVKKDLPKALVNYENALSNGDLVGLIKVYEFYTEGKGTRKDLEKAQDLVTKFKDLR